MFYPHQQSTSGTSASKHHDANGDVRLGGGGGGGGGGGDSRGGGGGWARHPSFTPSGMPMPSPGGYPALGGGGGGGGGGGYVPPPVGGAGGHGHHQHAAHVHSHGGLHSHGPHHPSFGNTGSSAGLGGPGGAGGLGGGHGLAGYGGMAMFGGGGGGVGGGGQQNSPPRNEPSVPLTQHWQNQLMRADASRLSASPHHRARAAAISSRATNKPSAITITDPNNRPNSSQSNAGIALNGVHRKQTSLSVLSRNDSDRGITPPPPPDTPGHESADPATPNVAPAHDAKEDDRPAEPWTGLDLGGIKLRTISTALFSFTHITSLYINHNCITSIPPAVSQLRNLTLLDATGNDLSSIPPEIGVLSRLKELLLFDNHLTTLPFELGTLYNLETLGIEGNPLDERLRKLLAEEGTTGLITYMRDNCSAGPAPPERQWVEIEPDVSSPSSGEQETFTVLTYNILCASFAPAPTYMYTPSWALDWNYRKHVILNEIVQASADVVCLQEIDCEQYAEFFLPQLKKHGYEGQHYPRSRARTMSAEEQKAVDGCATFWKDERFSLVETQVVEFNQLAISKTDMRTEDMFNRVMSRDNIAVVAKLEFRASGARLLVCNSHIYWDHRYRDVKLVQIGMLVEELEKIVDNFTKLPAKLSSDPEYNHGRGPPKYDRLEKGRDIPLIMCVDLNSLSGSAVYDYLSTGEIAGDHEDFMSHVYGTYTNKGLRHRLGLRSACASFGELKMTNYTPTFSAAIDYIFYTPRNMKVTSVLGDVDKEYLDKVVGFPNAHFPSDHIPVFAQFRLKGQSDSNGNTY
ncbi:glucose-repressible alcohol dehydrogenase transcriptional effector [Kwoniella heveanensis BCC8398]|uniref:CCR4-Not complex 3'-5'-exoribonuclease subunit Ccr4 n=1 Tax=Kwoniella heveanensis BCC8398 TaxID=1296120 RepID=A0A1B9GTG1_9TREE|nr:glucose-repressible alcohol dehydrogenase transcriptional effector [Kwoniella heveanensis BCC8398]